MTIELVRRLLGAGAPLAAVESALVAESSGSAPFVCALIDRHPELSPLIERELARVDSPEIHLVRPDVELVSRLPRGLCQRLLAVPVHRDAASGRIDVAAVDTLGPHVATEFGFHLQAPVRVLRAAVAPLRQVLATLAPGTAAPMARPARRSSRPPPPQPAPVRRSSRPPPRLPSDAPIPLVRRPPVSGRPQGSEEDPVLNLSRSKFIALEAPFSFELPLEEAALGLAAADSAEQVAKALCRGLEPALSLLVAVRAGSLEVRARSSSLDDPALAELKLPAGKNSVFDVAVRAGFYLGPLLPSVVHEELRALLPAGAAEEVYAAPVLVNNRPALVLLMARFGPSLEGTRRADRLLRAAAAAIERIVLSKKRGAG